MDRVVFLKSNEEVFEQSTLSWSDYPTRSLTSHGDYQAKLSQYFLDMLRINFASFFFFYFIYICIYVFILAVLGLHSCVWAFCCCSKRGYFLVGIHPLLTVVASRCRAQALGHEGSIVGAHRLSCSVASRIFLDQG